MASAVHRTTKQYLASVNTPEYPTVDWIINPDLSAVTGWASKYWLISGDTVSLMSPAQRATVDADEAAAQAAAEAAAASWNYIKLASDFVTGSASAVDVTGLNFTPAANTSYEFEAYLLTRTATATVGPRPGVAWPTGLTDGATTISQPSSASASVAQHGNISAAVLAPVGGVPSTNGSWLATVRGFLIAGASPSGTLRIQLASETAATNVTIKAGSFLRYRVF